jgi:hypothetical protein
MREVLYFTLFFLLSLFFSSIESVGRIHAATEEAETEARQFYQFDPRQTKIDDEIAYNVMTAYNLDWEKTLLKLKTWPNARLLELPPKIEKLLSNAGNDPRLQQASMSIMRLYYSLIPQIEDMTGSRKYSEVITGRIGDYVPQEGFGGNGAPECFFFHPDGNGKQRSLCIYFAYTVTVNDDRLHREGNLARLFLLDKTRIGKIEYLGDGL